MTNLTRNLRDLEYDKETFPIEKGVMQNGEFVPFKRIPELKESLNSFRGKEKVYVESYYDYMNLKRRYEGYKVWGKKKIKEAFNKAWELREVAEEARIDLILEASMYSDFSIRIDEIGRIIAEEE